MEHQYIIQGEHGYEFHDDTDKREKTELAVKDINNLSNLPCKLLGRYSKQLENKLTEKGYGILNNFMSVDFESADATIICSGYPHDEAKDSVIMIRYTSNKYDVLGVKIGMILEEAIHILESYGYHKENDDGESYWENNDVQIYVDGELFVEGLRVDVVTYYLGNRIY
ncbi:MAG: hypothetical protein PHQ72_00610 [Hespellia sp.]|nr:hypothetical protein [Hespellia sp.]